MSYFYHRSPALFKKKCYSDLYADGKTIHMICKVNLETHKLGARKTKQHACKSDPESE